MVRGVKITATSSTQINWYFNLQRRKNKKKKETDLKIEFFLLCFSVKVLYHNCISNKEDRLEKISCPIAVRDSFMR